MTLRGIVGRPDGAIVPLLSTTKQSKEIDISAYISAYTGSPAYTVQLGRAVFRADSNGLWRMEFNIYGTITATAQAAMEIQIAGVTFYGSVQQIVALKVNPIVSGDSSAFARAATGRISCDHFSGTVNAYGFSGDVLLASEPTWSSLGTTYAAVAETPGDVSAYIPMADAATAGLLSTAAQTKTGVMTFTDGIKLGNNETLITYNETALSGVVAGLTGTPAVTGKATRIGNIVTVTIDWLSPTTVTGPVSIAAGFLPTDFRPSAALGIVVLGYTSSAYAPITLAVAPTGAIEFFLAIGGGNLSSNAGWYRSLNFSFVI